MKRENIIVELRNMAERLRESLRIDKYSMEYREQVREDIKTILNAADELERLELLEKSFKSIFNI